jgi:hypothetical protein
MPTPNKTPIARLAYSLDEAFAAGGPSRATLYRLEKRGGVKLIRVAGRTKITAPELHRLLQLEASQ